MRDVEWLGVDNPRTAAPSELQRSTALADAARSSAWPTVFALLKDDPHRINAPRIGGSSGFTPLHQAAYVGASTEVVHALLEAGALRTLRTTAGERALDLARQRGHHHLLDALDPRDLLEVPAETLQAVEAGVHRVIRERQGVLPLLEQFSMRLPPLEVLTEIPTHQLWFPVPGMYGGFHLRLGIVADEPVCVVDSWVRVVMNSEERVVVTRGGSVRLERPETVLPITSADQV